MDSKIILEALQKYDELNSKYGLLGENKNVIIEMLASESAGSVSCKAHRPKKKIEEERLRIINIIKEEDYKFDYAPVKPLLDAIVERINN